LIFSKSSPFFGRTLYAAPSEQTMNFWQFFGLNPRYLVDIWSSGLPRPGRLCPLKNRGQGFEDACELLALIWILEDSFSW
jgi:hypothetical protein